MLIFVVLDLIFLFNRHRSSVLIRCRQSGTRPKILIRRRFLVVPVKIPNLGATGSNPVGDTIILALSALGLLERDMGAYP